MRPYDAEWWEASMREQVLYGNVYFDKDGNVIRDGYLNVPGRPKTPSEEALIAEAEMATELASFNPPARKCLRMPPGEIAGEPIVCELLFGHSSKIKHRDRKTGYAWWG